MLQNKKEPSDFSRDTIRDVVEHYTLDVFQALNKYMNEMGLCISISAAQHNVQPTEVTSSSKNHIGG